MSLPSLEIPLPYLVSPIVVAVRARVQARERREPSVCALGDLVPVLVVLLGIVR
jgi:hypothetical protein